MTSISKRQLELLASGILDDLGTVYSPSIFEGDTMEKVLQIVAQVITLALVESAREMDVVATHELIDSIDPTDSRTLGTGSVEVGITMPPHWRGANDGQPPGIRPKIKDIEEWISAKGIPVRQARGHSLKTVLQMRHQMAVAIANKIKKKGTIKRFGYKGSHFIERVMTPDNIAKIGELVAKLYGQKIDIYLNAPSP